MDVKELRLSLGVTRSEFAWAIGASRELVKSWELGRRQPNEMAAKLLGLLQRNPALLNELRDKQPNATTLKAMDESRGDYKAFTSLDDLMADLNS